MTRRERQRYARFGIPLAGLGDVVNVGSRMTPDYVDSVVGSSRPPNPIPALANPFANLTPIPGLVNPGINPGAGYGVGWGDTAILQARPPVPQPVVQAGMGISPKLGMLLGLGAAALGFFLVLGGINRG